MMMTQQKIRSTEVDIPSTPVSVYDAIFRRRMAKEFTDAPVSDETLNRLFAAAVWAPNHRLTEPTRFFVLPKDSATRARVAEQAAEVAYRKVVNPNPEQKRRSSDASRSRVLDAPAMVYVYSLPGDNEEVTQENYATACCAVQNMALAAVAEGLCLDWSTGGVTQHPDLSATLGAEPDWLMVGAVFLGQPRTLPASRRTSPSEMVTWMQ
jgi:nitroreductase